MALPAPNLDDRRFQNLVDDAKRLVQRRCPEWTDHNVSDPGVTLIETFAYMTDQLLYRLNRVPDRNYIKFLELIGVRLFPPTAATTKVTFWLSAPQATADRRAARSRGRHAANRSRRVLDRLHDDRHPGHRSVRHGLRRVRSRQVEPGATIPTPSSSPPFRASPRSRCQTKCCSSASRRPSLAARSASASTATSRESGWTPSGHHSPGKRTTGSPGSSARWTRTRTGGLNRAGEVVLHVPPTHVMSLEHQLRAGWLRARVTTPEEDQPFYSNSPLIKSLEVHTVGGTIEAVQAEVIEDEVLGTVRRASRASASRWPGRPSSRRASRSCWRSPTRRKAGRSGRRCRTSPKASRMTAHFVLDAVGRGGAARSGRPDARWGASCRYGAVPPKGSVLRLRSYHTGGGRQGNVAQTAIRVCRTTIPYVARVENRLPGDGRRRRRGHRRSQDPGTDRDAHAWAGR